jgi:DNA-binding MarR family transcriptional regulator
MDSADVFQIPPAALLEVCVCHMTRRAARAVTRAYDAALAAVGLTSSQFTLLATVAAAEPVSVGRLSEMLLMEASTLSRNLKALRALGHLVWQEGAGRRAALIELSAAGRKALGSAIPAWQDMQRTLTQRLGSGKASALLENLEAAAKALGTL